MVKYLPDILTEIDNNPSLIDKYMKDVAFSIIMQYAFDPEKKMNLPEGAPDYKRDAAPIGMNPTTLRYEAKRLYVFTRGDVSQLKREVLFVQLLESLHPTESEILLAVKDQRLDRMYPNINKRLMTQFGFCPIVEESPESQVLPKSQEPDTQVVRKEITESMESPVKRGRGRPKKSA
jgi:hypothetical protein